MIANVLNIVQFSTTHLHVLEISANVEYLMLYASISVSNIYMIYCNFRVKKLEKEKSPCARIGKLSALAGTREFAPTAIRSPSWTARVIRTVMLRFVILGFKFFHAV